MGDADAGPIAIEFGTGTGVSPFTTPRSFGGIPSAEAPNTGFTGAWGPFFWCDDVGNIVPTNAGIAPVWSAPWTPPAASGSSTITHAVSGRQYLVTLTLGKYSWRERFGRAVSPDNNLIALGSELTYLVGKFPVVIHKGVQGAAPFCKLSQRDGHFNRTNLVFYFENFNAATYPGVGVIEVTSDTLDPALDANGYPRNEHGGMIGGIWYSPAGAAGVDPVQWSKNFFYLNQAAAGPLARLWARNAGATALTGPEFLDNGFKMGPAAVVPIQLGGIGNLPSGSHVARNTFRRVSTSINSGSNTDGHLWEDNSFGEIRNGDAHQLGVNSTNHVIRRWYAFDGRPLGTLDHCDGIQHLGFLLGVTGPLGTIGPGIVYDWDGQGIFLADTPTGVVAGFTSGQIINMICSVDDAHTIYGGAVDNYLVTCCNALNRQGAAGSGIIGMGDGTGATVTRNLANLFDYADPPGFPQLPVVTKIPDPQVTLAATTAAYVAVFPGYVDPTLATNFSIAALKGYFTPSTAAYNGALQLSGALKPDGSDNT